MKRADDLYFHAKVVVLLEPRQCFPVAVTKTIIDGHAVQFAFVATIFNRVFSLRIDHG